MRLNELYERYKDQVDFLVIYTREAHPDNGWRVPANLEKNIHYDEPTTDDERTEVATVCQIEMDIHMPMAIDSIDNNVERKYVTLPMRLYLIDKDGKVVFHGAQGPYGWDDEAWEEEIKKQIAR